MLVCSSKLVQLHGCEGTTSTIHVLLSRSVLSMSVIAHIKHSFILLSLGVTKVSVQVKNGNNKVKRDTIMVKVTSCSVTYTLKNIGCFNHIVVILVGFETMTAHTYSEHFMDHDNVILNSTK